MRCTSCGKHAGWLWGSSPRGPASDGERADVAGPDEALCRPCHAHRLRALPGPTLAELHRRARAIHRAGA